MQLSRSRFAKAGVGEVVGGDSVAGLAGEAIHEGRGGRQIRDAEVLQGVGVGGVRDLQCAHKECAGDDEQPEAGLGGPSGHGSELNELIEGSLARSTFKQLD